ncbi:MAG: hypothetical protein V1753_00615, partial [Pseudomonadota bacterium]
MKLIKLKTGWLLWGGVGLAIMFWFLESALHAFVFHEGDFATRFFHPVPHEIWMRSLAILIMITYGFHALHLLRQVNKTRNELEQMFNAAVPLCV